MLGKRDNSSVAAASGNDTSLQIALPLSELPRGVVESARIAMVDPLYRSNLEASAKGGSIKGEHIAGGIIGGALVSLGLLTLFWFLHWLAPLGIGLIVFVSVLTGASLIASGPGHSATTLAVMRKLAAEEAEIKDFISSHLKTLVLKYERGHKLDEYGNTVDCGWSKELTYFWENVMQPRYPNLDVKQCELLLGNAMNSLPKSTIDQWLKVNSWEIKSGTDFELFVKQELESRAWKVRHSGKAGDQGADLLASKNGTTFAIQCKHYSSPVGNSAVQEAYAARQYYSADYAAVISNATFTRSAEQLAQASNVMLLQPSELEKLEVLAANANDA